MVQKYKKWSFFELSRESHIHGQIFVNRDIKHIFIYKVEIHEKYKLNEVQNGIEDIYERLGKNFAKLILEF